MTAPIPMKPLTKTEPRRFKLFADATISVPGPPTPKTLTAVDVEQDETSFRFRPHWDGEAAEWFILSDESTMEEAERFRTAANQLSHGVFVLSSDKRFLPTDADLFLVSKRMLRTCLEEPGDPKFWVDHETGVPTSWAPSFDIEFTPFEFQSLLRWARFDNDITDTQLQDLNQAWDQYEKGYTKVAPHDCGDPECCGEFCDEEVENDEGPYWADLYNLYLATRPLCIKT